MTGDQALAAIERVERLHRMVEMPEGDYCLHDGELFPCATRLAIDETGPPPTADLYPAEQFAEDQGLIDAARSLTPQLRITPEQAFLSRMDLNLAFFIASETECRSCVTRLRSLAAEAAGLDFEQVTE